MKGNLKSEEVIAKEDLRQEGVLSPTLFGVVMNDATNEIKTKVKMLNVGYRNLALLGIIDCAFTDNLVTFARNEKGLQ